MIKVNGTYRESSDDSVATLLARMGIDTRGIAVALNGEVVRRSEWDVTKILDGATVEIVTAAAGG